MKDYSVSRLALLAWVASQGVPAFSQQAQEDEQAQEGTSEPGSSDIVVTAQRRSESIMRVPIAVTALGTDTLASRGISNASGLASAVPSLQINSAFGDPGVQHHHQHGPSDAECAVVVCPI